MMTHRPKSRFTNHVRSLWRGDRASGDPHQRARRRLRKNAPGCEVLEGRVVLSVSGGGSLLGSLSDVGVVTSPIIVPAQPATAATPWGSAKQNAAVSQLQTDVQKLLTELQTLAGKSGVTIADLESLTTDSQSIAQAGFHFNAQTLNPVISELAVAVAGTASTAQAQSDFTALFSGSSVSTTVINSTFNDLVKAISDSAVTTTDLSTVASDEAAIKTDLGNLPGHFQPNGDGLLNLATGPSSSLSLASTAFSLPDIVVGSTAIPITLSGGSSLLGSLSYVGVITTPVVTSQMPSSSGTSTSAYAQLKADIQKLQAELQTLATQSGLTIADLESLTTDGQSIAQAGFHFTASTLNPVISELATAVAGSTSTAAAQTAFTNLFSGSSVATTVINTTFSDLVKAIGDSKVTTTDLSTVSSDEAAIQTDLGNLHKGSGSGGSGGTHPVRPIPRPVVHPIPLPVVHIPEPPHFRIAIPQRRR
jgi:DNA-binding IclR family transcriptional regulator